MLVPYKLPIWTFAYGVAINYRHEHTPGLLADHASNVAPPRDTARRPIGTAPSPPAGPAPL